MLQDMPQNVPQNMPLPQFPTNGEGSARDAAIIGGNKDAEFHNGLINGGLNGQTGGSQCIGGPVPKFDSSYETGGGHMDANNQVEELYNMHCQSAADRVYDSLAGGQSGGRRKTLKSKKCKTCKTCKTCKKCKTCKTCKKCKRRNNKTMKRHYKKTNKRRNNSNKRRKKSIKKRH